LRISGVRRARSAFPGPHRGVQWQISSGHFQMRGTDMIGHAADRGTGSAKALDRLSVACVGSRWPMSDIRYFQAVKAWASRHSGKSASVRFDKNSCHARSKSGADTFPRLTKRTDGPNSSAHVAHADLGPIRVPRSLSSQRLNLILVDYQIGRIRVAPGRAPRDFP
jgi:hypothetical protein